MADSVRDALSPLVFIIIMDNISRCGGSLHVSDLGISSLLFARSRTNYYPRKDDVISDNFAKCF